MNLATLALRNLGRRRTRSIIVATSIGLAIGSVLSLLALADSIQNSTHEGIGERGSDMTVAQRDTSDIFSGYVPESIGEKLKTLPGVAGIAGELLAVASIDGTHQRVVNGWTDNNFFWKDAPIVSGRVPNPGERHVAFLGSAAATSLGKKVGDDINILDASFTVVGIADYHSALNRMLVVVPIADLQELTFRPEQASFFHIALTRQAQADKGEAVRARVAELGRFEATPTDQLLDHDRNLAVLKAISRATSLIAMSLGALSVLNALLMAVQERTREIGVMMAIGWNKRNTMLSIMLEGIFLGIGGCIVGVILGYAASFTFTSLPTIGEYLSFRPNAWVIALTLVSGLIMCALGSIYPAWRATTLTPAEAIRKM